MIRPTNPPLVDVFGLLLEFYFLIIWLLFALGPLLGTLPFSRPFYVIVCSFCTFFKTPQPNPKVFPYGIGKMFALFSNKDELNLILG